jgi:drug/metabolite transporter (DMT)-like permease
MVLAATGVCILSFDSLLVRLAGADDLAVLFWRGAFMALSLAVTATLLRGRAAWSGLRSPATWIIAGSFSAGTAAFVLSILHTRVANTVVIISSAPLFAALFSGWFLKERVAPRTWAAILFAFIGVLLVSGHSLGDGGLTGDLLALANAVLTGASMTLLRRHLEISRVLILALSGALLALAVLPFASPAVSPHSLLVLALMGLVQIPLSLYLIADATRHIQAAEVSLFLLLETILAPLWAWHFLGEGVSAATLAGGALIVATLALHALIPLKKSASPDGAKNAKGKTRL